MLIRPDGRGCWRDTIFGERLWRSLTYKEVYLHVYDSAATAGIGRYPTLSNTRRPPSSLADQTPDEAYFTNRLSLPLPAAAKPARRSTYLRPKTCSDKRSHF